VRPPHRGLGGGSAGRCPSRPRRRRRARPGSSSGRRRRRTRGRAGTSPGPGLRFPQAGHGPPRLPRITGMRQRSGLTRGHGACGRCSGPDRPAGGCLGRHGRPGQMHDLPKLGRASSSERHGFITAMTADAESRCRGGCLNRCPLWPSLRKARRKRGGECVARARRIDRRCLLS